MKKFKKLVASLLAVLMIVSLTPVTTLADELELRRINAAEQPAEEVTELPADEPLAEEEQPLPEEAAAPEAVAQADTSTPYRIVHLDCGRKYFSVANIEKLIDTMAQYGYNQLQLAFGNGGCRFLLDDMDLSYNSFTMDGTTVTANIKAGNKAFNGDDRYLTESEMDAIIDYATKKSIDIVPMLNMPGHAKAIVYNTSYSSNDNLNVNNETARNYGYALLAKYVKYFKGKGCTFFHFGSDESGYTGDNMTAFLTGCVNVITKAGMTPRAFNDATNVATMPTSVQITYWHKESGSKSASALASDGHGMINTHGRWYYVIKTAQNSEIGTKYWQGTVNTTATSVELPVLKAEKMDKKWVGINEYFDSDSIGYGSTISGSLGTMFCIWCDTSQDAYLTDSNVISENENYGALYQIEKLAEHYWPEDIKKGGETTVPTVTLDDDSAVPTAITNGVTLSLKASKSVTWTTSNSAVIDFLNPANSESITGTTATAVAKGVGEATITVTDEDGNTASYTIKVNAAFSGSETEKTVELKVGETATFDVADGTEAKDYISGENAYIATAVVAEGKAQAAELKEVTAIESGKSYLIVNQRKGTMLTATSGTDSGWSGLKLSGTAALDSTDLWKIEKTANGYTAAYNGDNSKYLTLSDNSSSVGLTAQDLVLSYNASGYWNISYNGYYMNNLGGGTVAGGWKDTTGRYDEPTDAGSKWTLYEIVEASTGGSTLTITGTGEGTTEVTIGGVKYTIKVTAPETTEPKALSYGSSFTLPTGATAEITSGNEYVTIADGKVTAGQTDGTAIVKAEVKNKGGYVTARYTYNITVSSINFDEIADLPVQLWITNTWVGEGSAPTELQTVKIAARDAYSEEGILLSSKVPSPAYKKDGASTVKVIYWKGVVLHDGKVPEQQGADYSNSGDNFARIRYWDNNWQYLDGTEWKNIDTSANKDTVIAYYLQINDVSPEITTGTQHYGNPPTSDPGSTSVNGYGLTAFAVVYPDGTLSRTEQQMFETGMIRGYWGNTTCNIGTIYAENNSIYKISKITLTWGSNVKGNNDSSVWYTANLSGTYGTDWGVKWDKTTNSAGEEWYDETTYWKNGDSEIPMIDGEKLGLNLTTDSASSTTNDNGKNAALILIYLEVVETENTLNIVYWDDNADMQITTSPMPIPVVVNPNVTFLDIKQTSQVQTGTFILDDNAYIVNSSGANQTFNKKLSTVPGVTGVYLSGMYQYVSADISEDGMTLTLHFNLKSIAGQEKTYVVDFGLPLVVTAKDFGIENASSIAWMSLEKNEEKVTLSAQGNFGRATIAEDYSKVTYELNNIMNSKVTIPLYVKFDGESELKEYKVHIIPASNVYYEDSFAHLEDGKGAAYEAKWSAETDGTTQNETEQALEELGKKQNLYGYDGAYTNSTKFSMGSAQKVTVDSTMAANWSEDSTSAWPTATFTFKGTGFDVISLTDNNSGAIYVDIYEGENTSGTRYKGFFVNNYYGYKQDDNGNWVVDKENSDKNNALYQIPVMKVSDLPYGTYTVVINVKYYSYQDVLSVGKYSFWLDAIRIYNPMGENYSDYTKDDEGYPQYIKLRSNIIGGSATVEGNVLFIDGAENANIATYANFGPNNEVYLANGQAISFNIPANDNIASIQIGAKAPNGTATMVVNNDTGKVIETATEMYYEISKEGKSFTITNTDDGILSLTNLKITYSAKYTVSLAAMSAEEQTNAVMAVRALFAPPAPVVFEPATFTVKLSNYRDVYVREYVKVTVTTSDDVDYITVGDKKITRYTEERTWGGFRKGLVKTGNRIWSYYVSFDTAGQQVISVAAYDAEGLASEAVENTVNVKPRSSWRGRTSEWHI